MATRISATRYHDFSCGHRVAGHESKCRHLHGHNYRVTFEISVPALDPLGRVLDFGVMKSHLCMWLEKHWDHKMLLWEKDPMVGLLRHAAGAELQYAEPGEVQTMLSESIVLVPFNPTAENMAAYLLEHVGPNQLKGTGATLVKVMVEETRKCSAVAELPRYGACMSVDTEPAGQHRLDLGNEEGG